MCLFGCTGSESNVLCCVVLQCLLTEYDPESRDESVLWTQSEDMGEGYRCVRMANKITSNLDVLRGDKKSGGVKEGSPVILFAWKKQDNQIWKIIPACKMPTLWLTFCSLPTIRNEIVLKTCSDLQDHVFLLVRDPLCSTLSLHSLQFSYKSDVIYLNTCSHMQDYVFLLER